MNILNDIILAHFPALVFKCKGCGAGIDNPIHDLLLCSECYSEEVENQGQKWGEEREVVDE